METLHQIFILFLLLIMGYFSKQFKVVSNDMNHDMSNLILYITLPAMMIASLSSYEFSKEMLIKSGKLMILSWGVYALSIGFSYVVPKILGIEGSTKDIMQFMVVFSNVGFMGYPVVNAVFGEIGVFYTALYNLPFNILLWTFGVVILSRPLRKNEDPDENHLGRVGWKTLLNPGIVAVFIGFAMFVTSTSLPAPIFKALDLMGSTTTPLSMFFVGSILADMEAKKIFTNSHAFWGSIIRLIVLPMIVLGILKLMQLDEIMTGIPVIITAMPVAANCAIFATKYGNDYHLASQGIFISTLLSMGTIPLIVTLL
ncbi:AEC family transporter [Clostridiaceae bacterium 35-E11]